MKIVADKIDELPKHAITRDDVRKILSTVPSAWTEDVKVVRLCSSHGQNPTIIASLNLSEGMLLIKSRGLSKERVLRAVLTELAGHSLGLVFLAARRLQKRDESRVERLVAPLVQEILPLLRDAQVRLL